MTSNMKTQTATISCVNSISNNCYISFTKELQVSRFIFSPVHIKNYLLSP